MMLIVLTICMYVSGPKPPFTGRLQASSSHRSTSSQWC